MVRVISMADVSAYVSPSELGDGISYYQDGDTSPRTEERKEEHQPVKIRKRNAPTHRSKPTSVGRKV